MKVLEGVKVVEISMWAYVPSAGAALAEWGADVVKIEPPTGDPMRGLINAGVGPMDGITFPWELWNRNKRAIALDLTKPEAQEIVLRLCEDADVFLTSYLPSSRRKLGIDEDAVRARNPNIIYACGSGQGYQGPEADKGGYDSISFWSRGGVSAAVTPPGYPRPLGMPAGAFGDSLSGVSLAGGIAAALVRKARTGEGGFVDGSLLGTAMWCMQMGSVGAVFAATMAGQPAAEAQPAEPAEMPPPPPFIVNPLVNNYKTSDNRWVALCMLQPDAYWEGFVRAIGRDDMLTDPRFATQPERGSNGAAFAEELQKTFIMKPLAEWRPILASQKGQWDVIQNPVELVTDPQGVANRFVQQVDYGKGRQLPLFTTPVHFDREAPTLRPAPDFAGDTDEVLASIGMDEDAQIQAKISGAVV